MSERTYGQRVVIYMDPAQHKRLQTFLRARGWTVSYWVREEARRLLEGGAGKMKGATRNRS